MIVEVNFAVNGGEAKRYRTMSQIVDFFKKLDENNEVDEFDFRLVEGQIDDLDGLGLTNGRTSRLSVKASH